MSAADRTIIASAVSTLDIIEFPIETPFEKKNVILKNPLPVEQGIYKSVAPFSAEV